MQARYAGAIRMSGTLSARVRRLAFGDHNIVITSFDDR
jgi:hypothetical protein